MTVFIILLMMYGLTVAQSARETDVQEAVLNLSDQNFDSDPIIALDGVWEFYPKQLLIAVEALNGANSFVTLPGIWNGTVINGNESTGVGYGTYRLRVILPESVPPLSLEIPNVYSSYKLYINQELVANNGQTGQDKASSIPDWSLETKPLNVEGGQTLDLILQVSNFHHYRGGVHKSLYLGERGALNKKRELAIIANGLLVGGVLILGAFFITFFFIRKKDSAVIYFGLFCIIWSIRSMFANIYLVNLLFDDMSWTLAIKIEYISLYMAVLFGMLFISKVFSGALHKIFVNIITVINFLFVFLTMILSPYHFTTLLPIYQLFILANFLLVIVILISAVRRKRPEVWYSIIGILLGMGLFILELFAYYYELELSVVFLNLGFLGVFFFNSLVLAHRFVDAFNTIRRLEREQRFSLSRVEAPILNR